MPARHAPVVLGAVPRHDEVVEKVTAAGFAPAGVVSIFLPSPVYKMLHWRITAAPLAAERDRRIKEHRASILAPC